MTPNMTQRLLAEFTGTALLLTTVVGSGIMGERLAGGNVAIALLANSVATGAMLVVLITILGRISGAHFNPVVSAAMAVRGSLPAGDAVSYAAVQCAGGAAGVILAHLMFDLPALQMSQTVRTGSGQWIAEAVATFGLLLTIFGTLRASAAAVPAMVGLYILGAYWFTASTSFANPAVTLARTLTQTFAGIAPGDAPAFIMAQFAGAALAVAISAYLFEPSGAGLKSRPTAPDAP